MTVKDATDAIGQLESLRAEFNEIADKSEDLRKQDFTKRAALVTDAIGHVESGDTESAWQVLGKMRAEFNDNAAWWDMYAGSLMQTLFDADKTENMAPVYRDFAEKIDSALKLILK